MQALKLIADYLNLKPWERGDNLETLRAHLRERGFYLLPVDERNNIIEKAKNATK